MHRNTKWVSIDWAKENAISDILWRHVFHETLTWEENLDVMEYLLEGEN